MKDAIETLLENRTHATAQKLLDFHRANENFFPAFAAEFFWLKKRKRPGAAKSLLMFLRAKRWQGVDEYMVNNDIFPLLSRICILLYPSLNNRTLKLHQCEADTILGTWIGPGRGKKKGAILHASNALTLEVAQLPPVLLPPVLNKRSKRHRTVTADESAWVVPYVEDLVAGCLNPDDPLLVSFLSHARTQPEVLALAERKLQTRLKKRLSHFSILDDLTYAVQTAKRAGQGVRFTQPNTEASIYCRALIRRIPRLNGWTEFKEDSKGTIRPGRANAVLGCYPAPSPVNGEPHPRLLWHRDEVAE